MDEIQPTQQLPRLPGMDWRGLCSCALLAGVLLLPLSSVYAAPTLSVGAKRAVSKPAALTQSSKKSVGRRELAREDKAGRKTERKLEKQRAKAAKAAEVAGHKAAKDKDKKVATQPERTKGHESLAQKEPEPRQTRELVLGNSSEGPFRKRRAVFDKNTRLANTLQKRLGVEVQEDTSHSGGLFIAPPAGGLDRADKAMDLLSNLPLGKPLAESETLSVSSRFGGRQDPINGRKAFHEGIDFRAKRGTKVKATGKGKVVHSAYSPDYGENVIISHGQGYETLFAHLSKRLVHVGDNIRPGDLVGLVGNTGRSTGSHLHYEIRLQGAPINPTDYVKATQQAKFQKK